MPVSHRDAVAVRSQHIIQLCHAPDERSPVSLTWFCAILRQGEDNDGLSLTD
jgi:hypothetical protein